MFREDFSNCFFLLLVFWVWIQIYKQTTWPKAIFFCKINEKLSGSKSVQQLLKLKVAVSKQPNVSGTFIQATINFNSIFSAKVRIEPPMMETRVTMQLLLRHSQSWMCNWDYCTILWLYYQKYHLNVVLHITYMQRWGFV